MRISGRVCGNSGLILLGVALVSLSCTFSATPRFPGEPTPTTGSFQQSSGDEFESKVQAAVAATLAASSAAQPVLVGTPGARQPTEQSAAGSATASLQPPPTSMPVGCSHVADRTVVTAWIDQAQVAVDLAEDGRFLLLIEQSDGDSFAGKRVTFMLGLLVAEESGIWETGGGDELNLTATPLRLPSPTPAPVAFPLRPDSAAEASVLAQRLPPHVFLGTAMICG